MGEVGGGGEGGVGRDLSRMRVEGLSGKRVESEKEGQGFHRKAHSTYRPKH